jgi:hypothetical protein
MGNKSSTNPQMEPNGDTPGRGLIFISYHPTDSDAADLLRSTFEAAGLPVWRESIEIRPGEDKRDRIRIAISRTALVFVACFSEASISSVRSRQNEELSWAVREARQRRPEVPWLIPVRFDDCVVPDLDIGVCRSLQYLRTADLFGSGRQEELERLIGTSNWIRDLGLPASENK